MTPKAKPRTQDASAADERGPATPAGAVEAEADVPLQYVTLGSVDADRPTACW